MKCKICNTEIQFAQTIEDNTYIGYCKCKNIMGPNKTLVEQEHYRIECALLAHSIDQEKYDKEKGSYHDRCTFRYDINCRITK